MMDLFGGVKGLFLKTKSRLQDHSYSSLIWLINLVPTLIGFSLLGNKKSVPFFLFHLGLMVYLYGVGTIDFQMYHGETAEDFVKSFVNISLFALIANNTYWWIMKKSLLKSTLEEISESDQLAMLNNPNPVKHSNSIRNIKMILIAFYTSTYTNSLFVYIPSRMTIENDFAITPCVGMEPIDQTPYRQVCQTLLATQEITIMITNLSYQSLLLVSISYTEILYHRLAEEIMTLNDFDRKRYHYNPKAKEMLPGFIRRHVKILSILDKLQALYSVPIGVNFGTNAICISLFFFLPLPAWLPFMPILSYCFLVFFLYCYLCQRLSNAAEVYESAVYGCGWHSFEQPERKAVLVMLCQAQKPVELLAADIIPVNIATFATTCQAMYKFVTAVKL